MDLILKEKLSFTFLITLLALFSSCQKEESITPFTKAQTLAESQGRHSELTIVRGAFSFDELSIDSPIGGGDVPILGNFLNRLATAFANLFIRMNSDWEVEQAPMTLDLNDIPEIDPEIFINLSLKSLTLQIKGNVPDERASLDFIERIDLSLATKEMFENGEEIVFARYIHNEEELKRCGDKCLNFLLEKARDHESDRLNIMPLIIESAASESKQLYIIPRIRINSVPKANFKIEGSVDFKLGFKLPF